METASDFRNFDREPQLCQNLPRGLELGLWSHPPQKNKCYKCNKCNYLWLLRKERKITCTAFPLMSVPMEAAVKTALGTVTVLVSDRCT